VEYVADLTYRTVDTIELKLDLARPAGGVGPFPAVLVLNGGSWMDLGGDRKFCKHLLLRLAERGYVAVAVTHRSVAVAAFPAQIHDAKHAVCWLRGQAAKYRLDPNRIGAVGFSSGGHLACLLGSTSPADRLEETPEGQSSRVQAVVACYPPTDLTRLRQRALQQKPSWLLAQTTLGVLNNLVPAGKDLVKASPCTYARRNAAPLLLIHGSADTVVPCEQSELYEKQLSAVGAKVRLLKLVDAGHGFGSSFGEEAGKRSDDATLEFLDEQLKTRLASK